MITKLLIISLIFFSIYTQNILIAQTTKWLSVGSLHNWYSSSGCEIELGRTHLIPNQQDGLRWPAIYKNQDSQVAKGMWFGAINYNDQSVGKIFNYKVVHMGPRVENIVDEFLPQEFKLVGKFNHSNVIVDGVPSSKLDNLDFVDEVDPDLPSDRMIYNVTNTGMGITMTRKVYAFSQQNHDNYFIYDYVFENTGIVNSEGTVNEQTLNGVMFFFQYRYAISKEGGSYGYNWLPQNTTWGRATVNDVVYEKDGEPFRAQFSWLGKHSKFTEGSSIGGPNVGSGDYRPDGRLGASQFIGVVTLHADTSPSDDSDDISQPSTTGYLDSDGWTSFNNSQFDSSRMELEYELMTEGRPEQSHADAIGTGFADQFGNTGGGYSQGQGFGPYTMMPGESVHIVLAEAVAGLNKDSVNTIGYKWFKNTGPFIKPNGTITSDRDEYKDAWVMTGKDSLFQAFERAMSIYNSGITRSEVSLPSPPPPPSEFNVTSRNNSINLSWSNNAESSPGFSGYRIYRAAHSSDTTYNLIYECGGNSGNSITTEYDDTSVLINTDYYYYVTSFDNGLTNDIYQGVPLESSKFYTLTGEPSAVLTSISNSNQNADQMHLQQNYPNPFNPSTIIKYFISEQNIVTITVFDVLGRKISTLVNMEQSKGNYEIKFNASQLPGGVYYYRLQSGNFINTKKMILLK